MKRKVVMVRRPCSCEAWPFCEHASNAVKDANTHTQAPVFHDGKPAHLQTRLTDPQRRTSLTWCSRCGDWFLQLAADHQRSFLSVSARQAGARHDGGEVATPEPAPETAESVLAAIAAYWGQDSTEYDGLVCSAPIYPGAYLTERDEPIKDVVFRVVAAAKQRKPPRDLPATQHEGQTITRLLGLVDRLRECLSEAHQEEMALSHEGDCNHTGPYPEGCTYCSVILEAEDEVKP